MIQTQTAPTVPAKVAVAKSQASSATVAVTDAQPETTRIFVSGLPHKFASEQLAAHFASQFKVTDAHVLADRRIGFVGFTDSHVAKDAARHFNKTYIRMSKIAVELARPVAVSRDKTGNAVPVSQRRHTLGSNEANRKRKRLQEDDGEVLRGDKSKQPQTQDQAQEAQATSKDGGDEEGVETSQPAATDNDWLRGRTTRTLDLVDPDDVQIQQDDEPDIPEVVVRGTSQENNEITPASEDTQTTRVPNARLFLRNLAFSITDQDLRLRFQEFGKVQEVSIQTFFTCNPPST